MFLPLPFCLTRLGTTVAVELMLYGLPIYVMRTRMECSVVYDILKSPTQSIFLLKC